MKNCVKLFALQKVLIKFIKGLVACECKQQTDLNYSLFIIHYSLEGQSLGNLPRFFYRFLALPTLSFVYKFYLLLFQITCAIT